MACGKKKIKGSHAPCDVTCNRSIAYLPLSSLLVKKYPSKGSKPRLSRGNDFLFSHGSLAQYQHRNSTVQVNYNYTLI